MSSVGSLDRSARALTELFALQLRHYAQAMGRNRLARALGIPPARLRRAFRGTAVGVDLILRCGLAFKKGLSEILLPPPARYPMGDDLLTPDNIRPQPPDEWSIRSAEESIVNRLQEVFPSGSRRTEARKLGIPYPTLRDYLTGARVPLSLVWRVHLVKEIPCAVIASGKPESESAWEGRLPDLDEPVVRLSELYVFNDQAPRAARWIPRLETLLRGKRPALQKIRLARVLAYFWRAEMNARKFRRYSRQCWDLLQQDPDPSRWLRHLRMAGHFNLADHFREVAARILKKWKEPEVAAMTKRLLAAERLQRMEIHQAAHLLREAAAHIRKTREPVRSSLNASYRLSLGTCAMMYGESDEALHHLSAIDRIPSANVATRCTAKEFEYYIRLGLGDLKGAAQAMEMSDEWRPKLELDQVPPTWSRMAHELRLLVEKGNDSSPEERRRRERLIRRFYAVPLNRLWPDARVPFAVSAFKLRRDRGPLEKVLHQLVSGVGFEEDIPLQTLPDLMRCAEEAGLNSTRLAAWRRKARRRGMLFLNTEPIPPDSKASEKIAS